MTWKTKVTNAFRLLIRLGRPYQLVGIAEGMALGVTNAFRLLIRLGLAAYTNYKALNDAVGHKRLSAVDPFRTRRGFPDV